MAGETQASGGSVKTGQQAAEPEIEIIEEGDGGNAQGQQRDATDIERAGQYEYDADEGGEEEGDARTGHNQGGEVGSDGRQGIENTQQEQTARQRRRQREKMARDRERSELVKLRQENAALIANQQQLDHRLSNVEVSGIDGQIAGLESEIQRASSVMRRAMESQNGEDFVRAQEIRDVLRDRLNGLKAQKADASQRTGQAQGGQQRQQAPALPNGLHPQQVQFARIFVQRHPWYDTRNGTRDVDSQQVQQLDNEMMNQGFDPKTPEYWVELERRVQEEIPHKFQQAAANQGGNGGGPVNNGNGQGSNGRRQAGGPRLPGNSSNGGGNGGQPLKFHLSRERKQALIDLGVYDDPVQRNKHIKSFMAWDKDHQTKQ
jgi:hypothetical protein